MQVPLKKSQLHFKNSLPKASGFGSSAVLIYDQIFERQIVTAKWTQSFERRYAVRSGEKLKNIDSFAKHIKSILKLVQGLPTQQITIVVLGGGSVGDFAGFVASILKRGVRLIQIPSTWLAAVDSAHGGKTGLNVSKIKNQIGTFYPADDIYLIKAILKNQPEERVVEAFGEIIKISLLEGKELWLEGQNLKTISSEFYWKLLPKMIAAKYKIVQRDPQERLGIRHLLNFGHTLGHVWESQLKIPHGLAVLLGVAFAIEWSFARGVMSSKSYYEIRLSGMGSYLPDRFELKKLLKKIKQPQKFLLQDKKIATDRKIRFVLLKSPGKPIIESLSVQELLSEMDRQAL
jgi:3-dehydroquinate synthase